MKKILFAFLSHILFLTLVAGDDGLCGVEPPKDGSSCSGSGSVSSGNAIEKKIENEIFEKLVFDDFPENETELWYDFKKIEYAAIF